MPAPRLPAAVAGLALVALAAGCSRAGQPQTLRTSGSGSITAAVAPTTAAPHRSPRPAPRQRRAIRDWLAGPAGQRATGLLRDEAAVLADLRRHDISGAFARCQPEQVTIEQAQEGAGLPWAGADGPYQDALARLAAATTHCLDAAGRGDRHDELVARRQGTAARHRLQAALLAARRAGRRPG